MRRELFRRNTLASIANQIVTFFSGFILPKLILTSYGSDVNGLLHSITQFLSVISFMEMGMVAVVQSALYAPLANSDNEKISQIITDAKLFFRKLAGLLLIYVILLTIIYPVFINRDFDIIYTASLILILSIGSFCQYYFGITDLILLSAAQKLYINYNVNTVFVVLNVVLNYFLVYCGASIQILKLATALVFLIKPIYFRIYIAQHFKIDRNAVYEGNPIPQKWNGVTQHIAHTVLNSTDYIILTLFSTLSNVSIYSVYALVLSGIRQIYIALTNGIMPLYGDMWARGESDKLVTFFSWTEWILHMVVVFLFGCTAVLLFPFVQVYTFGINDANYYQPLFSVILTLAYAWYCLRVPYNSMILAAGQYKETQNSYIIVAVMNLAVSIILVFKMGLIGVAIGTFISMLYHTIWIAYYLSKNIIKWKFSYFIKQLVVDIISVLIGMFLTYRFTMDNVSYRSWVVLGIKDAFIWIIVIVIVNVIFYKEKWARIKATRGIKL